MESIVISTRMGKELEVRVPPAHSSGAEDLGESQKSHAPSDLGVKIWTKKKQGCLKWNEASQGTMLGNVGNRDRA